MSPVPPFSSRSTRVLAWLVALQIFGCAAQDRGASEPDVPDVPTAPGVAPSPGATRGRERPVMSAGAATRYADAKLAYLRGDLDGARAGFEQALELDPGAYQVHHALGLVRGRLGDGRGALSAYEKALSVVPDFADAILAYALELEAQGRRGEAEAFLGRQRLLAPRSAAVPAALAELRSLASDSAEAQRLAREALKLDPGFRPAMLTIARDHYRQHRRDLALYSLRGILDGFGEENPPRDTDNAEARLLRALILREEDKRGAAIAELERALKLRPDLVEANIELGAYLLESGNAARAVEVLENAVRFDPRNVYARLNLGDAYRLLGNPEAAGRELEWVARKKPDFAEAFYNLGLLYLLAEIPHVPEKAALERAIAALERFQALRPRRGGSDDAEDLLVRAKSKLALLEAGGTSDVAAPAQPARSAPRAPPPSAPGPKVAPPGPITAPTPASTPAPTQAPPSAGFPAGASPPKPER